LNVIGYYRDDDELWNFTAFEQEQLDELYGLALDNLVQKISTDDMTYYDNIYFKNRKWIKSANGPRVIDYNVDEIEEEYDISINRLEEFIMTLSDQITYLSVRI
jgi:hypothetical protein